MATATLIDTARELAGAAVGVGGQAPGGGVGEAGALGVAEVAEVLFATSLQPSDHPSPDRVQAAVQQCWTTAGGDRTHFAARLAQEAGDHPEQAASRMRWALTEAAPLVMLWQVGR